MNIIPLNKEHIEPIRNLWNTEMHPSFHLRKDLFASQVVMSIDTSWNSSFVALDEGKIVGSVIVKIWQRDVLEAYAHTAWITFIHVTKTHQRKGIGRMLMEQALERCKQQGVQTVHLGKSMNNFFCGVPTVFETNLFFEKIGFVENDRPVDMHKHITDKTMIPLRHKTEYDIRISSPKDFDKIRAFFLKNFPGRWHLEFEEYANQKPTGREFAIIEKDDKVIAFCRINPSSNHLNMYNTNFTHDFTNLYGVGPLGVDADYRAFSLGFDITAFAINNAVQSGASDIIIDWTSHIEFYQKFGFNVWFQYISMKYDMKG